VYDDPAERNFIDTAREFAEGSAFQAKQNMEALSAKPAEQHLIEMRANKEAWQRRPLLRAVYGRFYEMIRENLANVPGLTVELGSGIGAIKEFIPQCVTTDIFRNPWIDRYENAYALSFRDGNLSNLVLLDVFHHLEYPGLALNEFRRVLCLGGRVIIVEPAMGLLGRFVYGVFHHEPLGLRSPIKWLAPVGFDPEKAGYYAAQGNAFRVFVRNEFKEGMKSWKISELQEFPDLAYVASGGFRKPQLYPVALLGTIRGIERLLAPWPGLFATRLLTVLERPIPGEVYANE
jgi:SAM-dependent methyltransferase